MLRRLLIVLRSRQWPEGERGAGLVHNVRVSRDVAIRSLYISMAQNPCNFSQRHSLLNHSCPGSVTKAMKGQAIDSSMLNSGQLASFLKTSLDVRFNPKDKIGLVLNRGERGFQGFKFRHERRRNRNRAVGKGLRVSRNQIDFLLREVNVRPLKFQNLPESHPGCQGADNYRFEMLTWPLTRSQQSVLFVVGKRSFPSPLVGHTNKRIVFFKGHTEQPALLLGLPEHCPDVHQFPVDAGYRPKAVSLNKLSVLKFHLDLRGQAVLFVLLKFPMRDRSEFVGAEIINDGLQEILFRAPRALPFNDSPFTIDGFNEVAIRVPFSKIGKGLLCVSNCAFIALEFVKRFLKILLCLRLILASSPECVALSVESDIGSACIDIPAFDNDLELAFPRHESVYTLISEIATDFEVENPEESLHGRTKEAYNQGIRLFLIVSGYVGLLHTAIVVLIVDQEVVGSSPTSRPKTLEKLNSRPFQAVGFVLSTRKSPIPEAL